MDYQIIELEEFNVIGIRYELSKSLSNNVKLAQNHWKIFNSKLRNNKLYLGSNWCKYAFDDFETMLLKKKNLDGKFTESLKVEEELIYLIKKVVKDEEKLNQIIDKLNKFELAIGNETDLLCKHYYKLGIVDSKKILMEIGE